MCLLVVNASCIGPLRTPDALYCTTQIVELLQTWKDKSWRAVVEQYDLQELRNATLTVGDSGSEVQFIELTTASLHQELCRLRELVKNQIPGSGERWGRVRDHSSEGRGAKYN